MSGLVQCWGSYTGLCAWPASTLRTDESSALLSVAQGSCSLSYPLSWFILVSNQGALPSLCADENSADLLRFSHRETFFSLVIDLCMHQDDFPDMRVVQMLFFLVCGL